MFSCQIELFYNENKTSIKAVIPSIVDSMVKSSGYIADIELVSIFQL